MSTNMYDLPVNSIKKNPYVYHLPGVTPDAIETCTRFFQQNHERYHIFYNEIGFHNHTTHYLLAALGLGASTQTLERIYEEQTKLQVPAHPLHKQGEFDPKKCLGDDNYYHDYVEFFKQELENEKYQGKIEYLIEDYLFNKDYLALVLGGLYHAYLHLGYALEFQSKVMAIEGLAMAAIDRISVKGILAHVDFDPNKAGDKTALDIVNLMIQDHRFDDQVSYKQYRLDVYELLDRNGGALIAEYAQMWKCDVNDLRQADILVTAAAIRPKKATRLNFYLMHATTSSLFLEIFLHSFQKKENQLKFLRAKFAVDLFHYVAEGRPKLNVNYLLHDYQPSKEHSYPNAQNPWLPLIDKCLTHPEEHISKTIRALVYAEKFDNAEGKAKLPYLKIAQLVMDTLFPVDQKIWTRDQVGYDEYWKTVEDQ